MRLSAKNVVWIVTISVAVFVGGFVVGTRVGVNQFLLSDAQYKASILTAQLQMMKTGKADRVIEMMEINLNAEIANHGRFMDSHFSWLFPELVSKTDDQIRAAVAYRKANPYTDPDMSKVESWKADMDMTSPFILDTIEGQKQNRRYFGDVMSAYGDETHNPSLQSTPQRRRD